MNHSYFASLLENYRRRMDMDPSVLSIRKALYNSYNNESFKLKERQRHAMAKQRREEMEANRVFRNKIKEIKEKEKEISKRYAHLRMRPAENEMAKWKADKMKDLNYTQQKVSVFLPTINDAAGLRDGNAARLYQSEYHSSQERMFNKPHTFTEEKNSKQDSTEDSWHYAKSEMHLPTTSALNSNFTENLINHYKTSEGLRGIEKNSQVLGKKNNVGSSTFGERRSRPIEKRGAFNISSPHYDILIIEHEKDHSSSRADI
ncbi:hypothetical protein ACROYT_G006814 [Oculina patagonica]